MLWNGKVWSAGSSRSLSFLILCIPQPNVVSEQHNANIQGESASKGYVSKSVVWASATVRLEAVLEPVMNATVQLMW